MKQFITAVALVLAFSFSSWGQKNDPSTEVSATPQMEEEEKPTLSLLPLTQEELIDYGTRKDGTELQYVRRSEDGCIGALYQIEKIDEQSFWIRRHTVERNFTCLKNPIKTNIHKGPIKDDDSKQPK